MGEFLKVNAIGICPIQMPEQIYSRVAEKTIKGNKNLLNDIRKVMTLEKMTYRKIGHNHWTDEIGRDDFLF
jgi:hypothetical protein